MYSGRVRINVLHARLFGRRNGAIDMGHIAHPQATTFHTTTPSKPTLDPDDRPPPGHETTP